jgi:sulfopyruvate decarboxylase subunit beta
MVREIEGLVVAVTDAIARHELATIVAKVEAVGPAAFVTDLGLLENRFEFQRWLRQH